MAYNFRNIVDVVSVVDNLPIQARTFGNAIIVTTIDNATVDRVRAYSSLSAMLDDGIGSNEEIYKMATEYFANGIYGRPKVLYVGYYDPTNDASLEVALTAMSNTQQDFYIFVPDSTIDDTQREAVAQWVEANDVDYVALFNDVNGDTEDTGITTDLASVLKSNNIEKSGVVYAGNAVTDDFPAIAIAANAATVGFTQARPAETMSNKTLSLVKGLDITNYDFLEQKNCGAHVLVNRKGYSTTRNIVMADGKPFDVIQSVDYMEEQQTNALLDRIRQSKIPYTQQGLNIVEGVLARKCSEFLRSGILGAGYDNDTGEYLSVGYKITMPALADIPAEDKANRILRGVSVRLLLAGAIETIEITNYIQL